MLELIKKDDGHLSLKASLTHPIIYLDHWAVINFSNDLMQGNQFITLLKDKGGTLLLSQTNFFEAAGFNNLEQAEKIENFLEVALPNVHIVDFSLDTAMFGNTLTQVEKPTLDKFWMINFLLELAKINGGKLTFKTMFTEVIKEHSLLKPLFLDLKAEIARTMHIAIFSDEMLRKSAEYIPDTNQPPMNLMLSAYLYDAQKNNSQKFKENDSVDLIHAIPAVLTSDFVLLDNKWCNRTDRAEIYLKKHNVYLKIASRYSGSPEKMNQFFTDLSNYSRNK